MTTKDAIAKAPSGRVTRTPIGRRNILTVTGKEEGYQYRIVNDDNDRVQALLDAGYEMVPSKEVKVGDKRVEQSSTEGSVTQVSVGGGRKGYVMRIKDEWFKEDQAAKQKHVTLLEAQTKQKALDGNYGKLDITRE